MPEQQADPVVAEFKALWRAIRLLMLGGLLLLILLGASTGIALAIRANDLERNANQQASEEVRSCFRQSASRPALRDISLDPTLALSVRGFIRQVYENTPTRADCFRLADRLGQPPPALPPPETIR